MKLIDLIQHSLNEVTGHFRATPTMIRHAKSSKAQVFVEMSPLSFLRLTTPDDDAIRSIIADAQPLWKYNRWSKIGDNPEYKKFINGDPEARARTAGPHDEGSESIYGDTIHPFLTIEVRQFQSGDLFGKVVSHEGRHRAAAVMLKRGRRFPVALRLRPGVDLEIPGVPAYENLEYFMGKEFLPVVVRGQYNPNHYAITSEWTIVRSEPLRRAAQPAARAA